MSDSRLGAFEQEVMMAILRKGKVAFALGVRLEIERATDAKVSRGAFYTTLERLERKGLVRWESDQPPGSRRQIIQRRYSVTSSGVDALRENYRALQETWERLGQILEEA